MPSFRRLDEHFFALQTIFGVLHVRCDDVRWKLGSNLKFDVPFFESADRLVDLLTETASKMRANA